MDARSAESRASTFAGLGRCAVCWTETSAWSARERREWGQPGKI